VGRGLITHDLVDCGNCKATGDVFREKDKCKKCKGERVLEEKKMLEVYIARGSRNGDKIVLEGEADDQPNMETGSIVFVLHEKPHGIFTRAAADLSAHISVTLSEALCGFSRTVLKHLDGRGISISHPHGNVLKQGQVLKIMGEGMPYKKGDHQGDLYLTIDIEFPSEKWLSLPGNIENLEALLPKQTAKPLETEIVDTVDFDPTASMETFGEADEHGGSAWVDDDDDDDEADEDVQCAQQ